jgi:GNAT superfamily N-acetyltransferase
LAAVKIEPGIMSLRVNKSSLEEILGLRNLFLQENNFQIRYNACHERDWTHSYVVVHNNEIIGYGSVKGNANIGDRDTIFEFYLIPAFRNLSFIAFPLLLQSSNATYIECQSNDFLMTSMLYHHGQDINASAILFADEFISALEPNKVLFRKRNENDDAVFGDPSEPAGDFVLELDKEVVASGGFLLHYNLPFADIYMEVKEDHRKKGLGSYLVQELKKQCYLSGRVPAARCNMGNVASRATLMKAGMSPTGYMLLGRVQSA